MTDALKCTASHHYYFEDIHGNIKHLEYYFLISDRGQLFTLCLSL